MPEQIDYTRQTALALALDAFRNREDFSVMDVLKTAEAFHLFLTETDEVE